MKNIFSQAFILSFILFAFSACEKDKKPDSSANFDKLVIVTNITTANPVTGYVGTMKDLSVGNYTNVKSRQTEQYPYIALYKDYLFVTNPLATVDFIKKFTRQSNGTLADAGSITAPPGSSPLGVVIESDTKGYVSLFKAGKIIVFNPATMTITGTIDLTGYGLGDSNPDPSVMALRNGKLYVACSQTSDGFTSSHPAQVLIIDVAKDNAVTSITDSRSYMAGHVNELKSLFFDENGDLYVFCAASFGFGGPMQKSGFLRIKDGQNSFDPDYFFNVSDYTITGIPGGKIDYLQRMRYTGNGVLYATGNIYALASNPPNYVTDRTYGSFKVDLANQSIAKLNLPYSNGYSSTVGIFDNKILFGLAATTGVGIYTYDPATGTASTGPVVATQGDPSQIEVFD